MCAAPWDSSLLILGIFRGLPSYKQLWTLTDKLNTFQTMGPTQIEDPLSLSPMNVLTLIVLGISTVVVVLWCCGLVDGLGEKGLCGMFIGIMLNSTFKLTSTSILQIKS